MSESKDSGPKSGLWDFIKLILVSLAIVLPVRYYIAQPFIVRGASMEPNFFNSEYLIIDEFTYLLREPRRGEAIIFRYPREPRQFFIKRIIGLPNERVEIGDGVVKIFNSSYPDGFALAEDYLVPSRRTAPDLAASLGADEFFVLGDNRDFSSDSRVWGALERKFIVGRAMFRAWPFGKFGLVPNYALGY